MLSRTRSFILGSTLLTRLNSRCPSTKVFARSASDEQRVIRDNLPKYKKILSDLPPLTGLLTNPEKVEDAAKLRAEKLNIYTSYVPMGSNTNLLEAIFKAGDIDQLLRIIDENLVTMTSFYIGLSFEALDDMMQADLCDKATVVVAPEFKHLCSKAIYKLRFFESDEVLKLLKCLSTLKAPENTLIVQATLQMARNHINDFSIKELQALEETLGKFDMIIKGRESLLLALKDAIPLALERQIEEKQFADDDIEKVESFKPVGSLEDK